MKKHGIRLALLSGLLAILFSFTACSGWLLQILEDVRGSYHAEVDFESLEYKRPDTEAIVTRANSLAGNLSSLSQAKIVQSYNEIADAFARMQDMQLLLNIKLSLTPKDTALQEEALYMAKGTTKAYGAMSRLNYELLQSQYGESFFGAVSETEKELIRRQAKAMDETYAEREEKIQQLVNDYRVLETALAVEWNGASYTLEDWKTYGGTDKNELLGEYYALFNQKAGEIYLALIPLYQEQAKAFGYVLEEKEDPAEEVGNVQEYAYHSLYYRTYTPKEAEKLYAFVKEKIPALVAALEQSLTAEERNLLAKLPAEEGVLQKYESHLLSYFEELDSQMDATAAYRYMQKYHLSSIGKENGRTSGAFTTYLSYQAVPFLYLTTTDTYRDLSSFIHEFGHFYAFYDHGRRNDLDLTEAQSQGNEFLFAPYFSKIYGEEVGGAMEKLHLSTALRNLSLGCLMDEFQAKAFAGEFTTVEELNEMFLALAKEYGLPEGSYVAPVPYLWSIIPHNFETPFYYISYATSLIPALQIAALAQTDRPAAIKTYADLIRKDNGKYSLPALCEEIGLFAPISAGAFSKIEAFVQAVIKK